ncbi:hypothetical protein MA16_Dca002423 [Dendrobium catenatum]|uniref:Reverse transcriptase domain-containing protein n=1 Tax=Dendrobium catenatum TaxID=906689 RepID=A0A2I0W0G1_9ASPA|nr:hypothetical protein MA16_Dca002423 [Dendrobium catenatum]
MPFGLKNAPSIFQRKMDNIFGHLNYVMVYIDDILITSHILKEHYKHIKEVLKLCINNGIILSKKKKKIEDTKELQKKFRSFKLCSSIYKRFRKNYKIFI